MSGIPNAKRCARRNLRDTTGLESDTSVISRARAWAEFNIGAADRHSIHEPRCDIRLSSMCPFATIAYDRPCRCKANHEQQRVPDSAHGSEGRGWDHFEQAACD